MSQLGEGAFMGCSGLTQFKLPAKLILIPAQAFKGCAKLSSIRVPSGVKEIGIEAFMDCLALRQATIRANVGKIGSDAFRNDPVTIYGVVPSVAQIYAGSVGIPFVDLAAGMPGDADANNELDELDALSLIAFLVDGTLCKSMQNADTNGSGGQPDIADLAALIDLLLAK